MGCGNIGNFLLDPIGTSISDAIGFNSPADFAFSSPGDWPKMWKEDWRAFKHLMVPDMRRDREAMVNSATTPRRWIYGNTRVSGQLAFATSSGGNNEHFHYIIIFSGCPVVSMDNVTLDDKPISSYGAKAKYKLFNGTQTAACDEMIAASGGNWTADHVLRGCAYIYLDLIYDESLFLSGVPSVKVDICGIPLFDPRTGQTTDIHDPNTFVKSVSKLPDNLTANAVSINNNPALCILDYMLAAETEGGMGCDPEEINYPSFITAANICDEQVVCSADGVYFEKRYTCDGVFNIDSTPKKILDALLQSMVGTAVNIQGQWHIMAGSIGSLDDLPILDESWLNGGISFQIGSSKSERINTIKGTFVDPSDHWASKGFPPVTSDIYIAEDGDEELAQDLTLNFTTSPTMSQRIGKIILEKSRVSLTIDYTCNFKAFKLAPFQLVRINNSLLGWDQKLARVLDWEFAGAGGIKLSLVEENPDIYDWTPADVTEIAQVPITTLPDPMNVPAPLDLTLAESLFISSTGTVLVRVLFSWNSGTIYPTEYDVYVDGVLKTSTRNTWATLDDITPGPHQFAVEARNTLGAVSTRSTRDYAVLGKTSPPADITGLNLSFAKGFAYLTWDRAPDLDVQVSGSIVIKFSSSTSAAWDSSNVVGRFAGTATSATIPAASGTYLIKAEDSSGNQSVNAVAVVSDVPAMMAINEVASSSQAPTFAGTKANCSVSGGLLKLTTIAMTDSLSGNWDALPGTFDELTKTQTGTYDFDAPIVLSSVQTCIITAALESAVVNIFATLDERVGNLDDLRGLFDSGDGNSASAVLLISTSPDNSNWTTWAPFAAGEYRARAFKFRLLLTSYDPNFTVQVSRAAVQIDMPDIIQSGAVTVPVGGVHVAFPATFYSPQPHLSFTIYDAVAGDYCLPTNITATGFDIQTLDQSNLPVERVINWFSKGY